MSKFRGSGKKLPEVDASESAMPTEVARDRLQPKKGDKLNIDLPATPKKIKRDASEKRSKKGQNENQIINPIKTDLVTDEQHDTPAMQQDTSTVQQDTPAVMNNDASEASSPPVSP